MGRALVNKTEMKKGGTLKKMIQSAPRMRGVTPVPNGPLVKKNGSALKTGGKVKLSAGGEKHVIYKKTSATGIGKGKKGDIMVNHPTKDKGKWDTIDLTQKAGAKTVKQGAAATKKWHKQHPYKNK